jgi:hypothetical protein
MSQEPDPQQPQPDQPPNVRQPSWPGAPWDQQPSPWPSAPWDQQPPTGPQSRRAQEPDPPHGPHPRRTQGQLPRRRMFGWLALSLATVGGLVVGGTAGSLGALGDGGTAVIPAATVTVTATEAVEPEPTPTATYATKAEPEVDRISDGEYEVGVDIDPGRYKTVTPAEDNGSECYAEVYTADHPLEPDDPLVTETSYSGLTTIDIPNKTGAFFWSEGCGDWKKIG